MGRAWRCAEWSGEKARGAEGEEGEGEMIE